TYSEAQGIEAEIPQNPAGVRGIGAESPVAASRRCAQKTQLQSCRDTRSLPHMNFDTILR
ncbi:MAG: hypothetical protein LBP71_01180, partial [Spirochaetaceae bacterium]|nr:hypothetical protein [Spirochaetaceae bacterium]